MITWYIPPHLYTKLSNEPSFNLFRYREMWCFIQRSMTCGNLCGYVAVAEPHPLYGKHYNESVVVPDETKIPFNNNFLGLLGMAASGMPSNIVPLDLFIQVHCGLTWSSDRAPGIQSNSLGKQWWFGFDTSHAGDAPMIEFDYPGKRTHDTGYTYKDYNYVLSEVYKLADQLADMLPKREVLIDISPFIRRLELLKASI